MIAFAIITSLLLICSVSLNVVCIKKNLMLVEQRDELVTTIDESLNELDECYTRIAHNAEIPVLSDEPVIREVLGNIKHAKNVILTIAGKVVIYGSEKDTEDNES